MSRPHGLGRSSSLGGRAVPGVGAAALLGVAALLAPAGAHAAGGAPGGATGGGATTRTAPGPTVAADGRTLRFADRRVARTTRDLTGELVGISHGRRRYVVQTASGRQVPVTFAGRELPDRATGGRVRLRASPTGAVRAATITPAAARATPAPQRAYVALTRGKGAFASSDATITATVDAALDRWREESNGAITSFTRVQTKDLNLAASDACTSGSANWNRAADELFPGVDTGSTSGNHIIVIGPEDCAGGVGTVQAGIASGGRLNARWNPDSTLQTLMHELGHNFSLGHANACYQPLGPSCEVEEYANTYALMGYTLSNTPAYTPASLDSFERSRLGITDAGEVAPVTLAAGRRTVTGTYDLRARGTTAGLRGLRVTDPVTKTVYSIDWRSGGGRDALSGYALDPVKDNDGITVERIAPDGASAAVLGNANPDPGKHPLFGLTAGRSFTQGGVTITARTIGDGSDLAATSRVGVTLTDPSRPADPPPSTGTTPVPATGQAGTPAPAPATGASATTSGATASPSGTALEPAKLEVQRATVSRARRRLSVVAPITARASGTVRVAFRAAGRTTRFDATVDAGRRRVRIDRRLPAAQTRAGTGILTLTYGGDADTQPQTVRLRAASRAAGLRAGRPAATGGRVRASGRVSTRARGVVRVQLLFEPATGATRTLACTARIGRGRYRLDRALPADVRAAIDGRRGVVHSYTLFTGDEGRGIRGELASYQVLGAP